MNPVVVVDSGLSNVDSVLRAVQEAGMPAVLASDPETAGRASKLILPGVGNFAEAMGLLKASGWESAIRREVLENGIPLLGICLGMQLLAAHGTEGGATEGLNLIPGTVREMDGARHDVRIPHVGWNEVCQGRASSLFQDIPDGADFYFVHSYSLIPDNEDSILATTPYAGGFVSAVADGPVYGVQFHPEKSLKLGQQLIRNFLSDGN